MKKILLFVLTANFCAAQHPDLLDTNWEITKIVDEIHPVLLPPPMPYEQVTNFSANSPQLFSSFPIYSGSKSCKRLFNSRKFYRHQ